MHVGLFFGSFNPVHIGHMVLANYMLCFAGMDEVWLVVSPHNPLKQKDSLLNQNHRLLLVNLATENHSKIRSSNIEFNLPQPSYTIHTLTHLKEKYPEHQFSLIMGQDNLVSFSKWKNHEEILKRFAIHVYPRPNAGTSEFDTHPHVHFTEAPLMEISSTFIRQAIKNKKDISYFLPEKVWEEIQAAGFYK